MKKLYKIMRSMAMVVGLLCFSISLLAQERTVSGTVTDETGGGMPGVNVLVKGTSTGTVTDTEGNFKINVSGDDATLVFTFVGYASSEIIVGARSVMNIQLTPDVQTLSELVVTGYAMQEKKDLTGSVGTVKSSDLVQVPSGNVTSQLQGRVAGVTVSNDGRPGSVSKVRIRGFSSFGNNDPLYVVDGVPTQDISTLSPNDIENFSVLKDAGAASIYGSRAANGVVLITTKKGSNNGVKVNYNMYLGSQDPGKGPDFLLNTQEYADLQWKVYKNDGTDETHPIYGKSTNPTPTLPSWAGDTDWYKTITRKALVMNHDLSLSGGSQNSTFYVGMNYYKQDGIVIKNFSQRFSARVNSEFKMAKSRISIGENFTVTGRTGNGVAGTGAEGSPIQTVYAIQPIIPAVMTQSVEGISHNYVPGEYGGNGIAVRLGNGSNPYANAIRNGADRQQDVRVLGSFFLGAKIIEGLNFKTTFGGTYGSFYNTNWAGSTYENAENQATASYNETSGYGGDWVWTNTLTYDKTFGDHKLLLVAGYEAVKYGIGRGVSAARADYFSDSFAFRTVTNGAKITDGSSYYNTPSTLASMFARADYSFKDKYLLSATVRRDGSSRFAPANKYGTFPSVTAGWRVSEEGFMSGVEVISSLKIRGGYGTMGSQLNLDPSNQFSLYGGGIADANYDLTGAGSSSLKGFRQTRIGNTAAKWETQITTNIGFDAGFLDNKLQLSVDFYTKKSNGLLVLVPLSSLYGAADAPYKNIGDTKNTGIDLQLGYRTDITPDLKLDVNFTFTHYKNEIISYAGGDLNYFDSQIISTRIGSFNRNQVGQSMGAFFGYKVIGLFQSDSDVENSAKQDGAEPGFFKYADINGDGVITPDDRAFIGNPNPNFTYGLNVGLTYKNFDLTAFLVGSQGNDIFNYNKWWLDFWPSFQNQKSTDLLYNSWTPENPGASTPKASNKSNFSTNTQSNSYYIEDGSFARLRTLQIGYNFPSELTNKIGINKARLYVQGVNLFTITKYSGLDADVNNATSDTAFGVDLGNYPLVRQYLVGVNIGF
ncbi:MAG: TonB-dependent receptor [Chryseolinea sp.]